MHIYEYVRILYDMCRREKRRGNRSVPSMCYLTARPGTQMMRDCGWRNGRRINEECETSIGRWYPRLSQYIIITYISRNAFHDEHCCCYPSLSGADRIAAGERRGALSGDIMHGILFFAGSLYTKLVNFRNFVVSCGVRRASYDKWGRYNTNKNCCCAGRLKRISGWVGGWSLLLMLYRVPCMVHSILHTYVYTPGT